MNPTGEGKGGGGKALRTVSLPDHEKTRNGIRLRWYLTMENPLIL